MDFQTRSGVAGISIDRTPKCATAATTAFITAGVEAIDPDSPTPFAPSAFTGDGVVVCPRVISGSSRAPGMRYAVVAAGITVQDATQTTTSCSAGPMP